MLPHAPTLPFISQRKTTVGFSRQSMSHASYAPQEARSFNAEPISRSFQAAGNISKGQGIHENVN
jgi:hypothetical protein